MPLIVRDARWRRAQRSRQRRLTRRGQTTMAGVISVLLALVLWVVEPLGAAGPAGAAETPLATATRLAMLPPVGAAAPPPPAKREDAAPEPPVEEPERVPEDVLERLPVSRRVLEFGETPPGETRSAGRLVEQIDRRYPEGPLRVEYTLDAELTRQVFAVLRRGRVELGNVVVMDPISGRLLAYASTDPDRFPPTRTYPAASLVKVITAAAALGQAPRLARLPCRYTGSPYRLTPARLKPPTSGHEISLRRALATSNNQCLAQLAVHALGRDPMRDAIARFGWLDSPGPAHAPGAVETGEEPYDLGRLGSGLAGSRITPLHAAQLAATLVHGELVAPRWLERVTDGRGRELDLPATPSPRRVLDPKLTAELRSMLVDTTRLGTARRAFRAKGGGPLLGPVAVSGKTGSLSGEAPTGRYEWFIGVAPADDPRVVVASVVVQSELWWRTASQIAAEVLRSVFCAQEGCKAENAERYIQVPEAAAALSRTELASLR